MPIYMDRHNLPGVSLKDAAEAHHRDVELQDKYNCKALTYWVDEQRGNAFCLIEAPDEQAVRELHNKAHGLIPHEIIEVSKDLVHAFLGRIQDPEPEDDGSSLIKESAYRAIMVVETSNFINRVEGNQFSLFTQKFHNSVNKTIKKFDGRIVLLNNNSYLVSFKSVTDAVLCALKIQSNFKYITPKFETYHRRLNIGLSAGLPVDNKPGIFEDAINLATYMCELVQDQIVISSEVKKLYDYSNHNAFLDRDQIRVLKPHEESFLTKLMDFIERRWSDPDLSVEEFGRSTGYSSSQVYRKLKKLSGMSPNTFIREFRLHRALKSLHNREGNISEVAFSSGFNSPAYFTKCFYEKYGILPSRYVQQHVG